MAGATTKGPQRRRLSVEDRQSELVAACLRLIGRRPWDEITMADVASEAGASKPLLYHYFSTKGDLYLATISDAAKELREITRPDPDLPVDQRMRAALSAHLEWIEANALAYRAIIQGGISSDPDVQEIVEASRNETVDRLATAFEFKNLTPAERIALRGWVGFLEAASLEWLTTHAVTRAHLALMLEASVAGALRAARLAEPPGITLPPSATGSRSVSGRFG